MDTKRAKIYVDNAIESFELQRSNDIYKKMGLDGILRTYQLFTPNLASLSYENFALFMICSLSGVTLYSSLYYGHDLTDEINSLKLLKKDLINFNVEEEKKKIKKN